MSNSPQVKENYISSITKLLYGVVSRVAERFKTYGLETVLKSIEDLEKHQF